MRSSPSRRVSVDIRTRRPRPKCSYSAGIEISGSGGERTELTDFEVRIWADGPGQPAGRAPAQVRDRVRQMVANNYASHQEELVSPPLEPPAIERLGEIRVPTLVIVGDLDFSDTIAAMDVLAQGVPNARQVVFPGVAHIVNMEQPERFNATVLAFLAG